MASNVVQLPPIPKTADPQADLYPHDDADSKRMVQWCNMAFQAGDDARKEHETRWRKWYRLYRSYVAKRKQGEWRSRVFYPVAFWVIETILPRLVGQLPRALVLPVGPEDVFPARQMEHLLEWSANQTDLYLEQVKAAKSALIYGTGILKTRYREDTRLVRQTVPQTIPFTVPVDQTIEDPLNPGQPLLSPDGQVMTQTVQHHLGDIPAGTAQVLQPRTVYAGPAAEAIDIFNFWVAPESTDVDDARYVVHRVYRDMAHVQRLVEAGVYRMPPNLTPEELADVSEEPWAERLRSVALGGANNDATRQPVELLEFWLDDGRVITLANRKGILRCQRNPFDHGEKPFVRVVDHLVPHEFWGIGEVEPLEGLQDLTNSLVNQRVDNVRMTLNSMFAVNTRYIESLSDLNFRPGGVVRVTEDGLPPRDAIHRIDFGDVTQGSFAEAAQTESFIEKVSGVSAYQLGTDSPSLNRTATGVAILQEQGNTRFSLKTRLAELIGMKRLMRHFGTIIQQYMTEPMVVRLLGPDGQYLFDKFDPASVQGGFDYDIEAESTTQTEGARKDQAMTKFQVLAPVLPQAIPALAEDVLREFGTKDMQRYLGQYQTPPVVGPPEGQFPPGQPGLPPPEPVSPAALPPPGAGSPGGVAPALAPPGYGGDRPFLMQRDALSSLQMLQRLAGTR